VVVVVLVVVVEETGGDAGILGPGVAEEVGGAPLPPMSTPITTPAVARSTANEAAVQRCRRR
jgi:hypothetical protein